MSISKSDKPNVQSGTITLGDMTGPVDYTIYINGKLHFGEVQDIGIDFNFMEELQKI